MGRVVTVLLDVLIYSINVIHGKSIIFCYGLYYLPILRVCIRGLMVGSAVVRGNICKLRFYVPSGSLKCSVWWCQWLLVFCIYLCVNYVRLSLSVRLRNSWCYRFRSWG